MSESVRSAASDRWAYSPVPLVLHVADGARLHRIWDGGIVAVIRSPGAVRSWQRELDTAVTAGLFEQRAELRDAAPAQVAAWIARASRQLEFQTRDRFAADVQALAEECAALADAERVNVRLAAGLGGDRCGYHVDTCLPGAAAVGLVKAYCGPPTQYPEPSAVTSVEDFWAFLSRRERLVRERAGLRGDAVDRMTQALAVLDDAPGFLSDPRPRDVPIGATVAFRLLPIEQHWQPQAQLTAWIHRSPMCAQPRLAITVLAAPSAVAASLRQRARAVMASGQRHLAEDQI